MYVRQQAATNRSDCPGQLKILLGNQKFKVLCPNGQLNLSRELGVNWNFVIIFDIWTDVYDILFQNRLKVTPLTSFVSTMSQKRWCYKVVQAIFHNIKFWVQNLGTDQAIDLQCQVTPWGYLLRKICRNLYASMIKFTQAFDDRHGKDGTDFTASTKINGL